MRKADGSAFLIFLYQEELLSATGLALFPSRNKKAGETAIRLSRFLNLLANRHSPDQKHLR